MRGGMELPAFLLLSTKQHLDHLQYKHECRKRKSFELYQYYKIGTYLTVDKHTHVWLSALIKIECKRTLGTFPRPKKHQHYKYQVPYLFPDPTSMDPSSPQPSPLFLKRLPSPLFFKHLVCILVWYMHICIYYKYIFYKEIWIQIQQKCDKPTTVKEGFWKVTILLWIIITVQPIQSHSQRAKETDAWPGSFGVSYWRKKSP